MTFLRLRKISKIYYLIFFILTIGVLYKLLITANGSFLFNMDNARDLVDVRGMVVLKDPTFIGPNASIDGLFQGPAWYYILILPFLLSQGDPYSAIVLEIILWAIGGYYLLKITSRWGYLATIVAGALWVSSNFITLATVYAFNPNPIIFLMPVFIYYFEKYLLEPKLLYSAIAFFIAGLFFNFEIAFGIFMPVIMILVILLSGRKKYLIQRHFWLGAGFLLLTLLPEIFFELRNNFFMTKAVSAYIQNPIEKRGVFNLSLKTAKVWESVKGVLSGTLMNWSLLVEATIVGFWLLLLKSVVRKEFFSDKLLLISYSLVIIPFLFYIFLPMNVSSWHLGGVMVAILIIMAKIIGVLAKKLPLKIVALGLTLVIVIFAINNLELAKNLDSSKPDNDPSSYQNEIAAIDYVYQYANGQDFKVFSYLPSVIDYPYQYLFWWYGQKKYNYIPQEYAYLPGVPEYIKHKDQFLGKMDRPKSGLVFLIKEPDRIGFRHLWDNNFKNSELVERKMIGPLEVEVRKEL